MGRQTIVHGYIETALNEDEYNLKVLKNFKYDKSPLIFRNIFYGPVSGYKTSMITFARSYYNIQADWNHWQDRFEELLGNLKATIAYVSVEDEDLPEDSFNLTYISTNFAKSTSGDVEIKSQWTRMKYDCDDRQIGSDEIITL